MSDIVERLRDNAPADHGLASGDLMREAADQIKRLRKDVAELLDALSLPCPTCGDTREDADARMEPKP